MINHAQSSSCEVTQVAPHTTRKTRIFAMLAAFVLLAQSSGCVSTPGGIVDNSIGGFRNHVWSNRAYNLRYGSCNREFADHFKQGFVDGYNAVCKGGDGYVPAIPPEQYLSYQYQSAEGAKCVNTWFKAYPLGVKAAREDGSGAFQKVYISKMIKSAIVQDKADHVLPDDVPVVAPDTDGDNVAPPNPFESNQGSAAKTANQGYIYPNNGPGFRY